MLAACAIAMKSGYKLIKARTNETKSSALPQPTYLRVDEAEQPVQISFEDPRRAEARQVLKKQLTSTSPEGVRQGSPKSPVGGSMPLKDRMVRRGSSSEIGGNIHAKTSSSTINSVDVKRLSAMPEQTNKAIDIEHAINLLQELKKTASPEDLVALHRALLPTKDVETVTSPVTASFDGTAIFSNPTPYRRGSVIPPGLATRGGFSEDLLRRQGEPQRFTARRTFSSSIRNLAALDLADDLSNVPSQRPATPSENIYPQMGAYRPGTLRITNGAASPEPSIKTERNFEEVEALDASENPYVASSNRTDAETAPGRSSMDSNLGRRASEDSLRISGRFLNSEQAKQQRGDPLRRLSDRLTPTKESFRQQSSMNAITITPPTAQSSERDNNKSATPDSHVARFQQRRSHRASQISAEYASDCEVPASPFDDEKTMPHQFATRLSTVYDSDADEANDVGCGTPAAALAMLNGESKPNDMDCSDMDQSLQQYNERILPRPESKSQLRPLPQTIDSGYSSDISFPNTEMEKVRATQPLRTYVASDDGLKVVQQPELTDHSADDAQSLYTFKEILNHPDLLSVHTNPDRPQAAVIGRPKKSSSFLKFYSQKTEKRMSLPTGLSSVAAVSSNTIATVLSTQSSPAGGNTVEHAGKHPKKLQKPMPKALRKQLREERDRKEMAQGVEVPTVPQTLSVTHAKRMSGLASGVENEPIGAFVSSATPKDFEEKQAVQLDDEAGEDHSFGHGIVKTSSSRRRSQSVSRKDRQIQTISGANDFTQVNHPGITTKLRSRSHTGGRGQLEKNTSSNFVTDSDKEGLQSPGEDDVPAYIDIGSVARALGSGSYDISTNLFKRNAAPVPGAVQNQIQSPYMISTGLNKTRIMKGMTPEMASELARRRSRDSANPDLLNWEERPRMAIPTSIKSHCAVSNNGGSERSVPKDDQAIRQQLHAGVGHLNKNPDTFIRSNRMYAESIPPLPELPADIEEKASKADEMVAKKLKDSARSSPAGSSRNSREVEACSPAMLATTSQKEQWESADRVEQKTLALLHPIERPLAKQNGGADCINVAVRELSRSNSDESTASGYGEVARWKESVLFSHRSSQHAGWPGWEHQAKVWRQHRESLGGNLRESVEDGRSEAELPPDMQHAAKSPSIVVSRYITPTCADNTAKANFESRPTDRAAQHADEYRALIEDGEETGSDEHNLPFATSTASSTSTATLVTVKSCSPRSIQHKIPVNSSTRSPFSYQTTVTTRTTATLGRWGRDSGATHVQTTESCFVPYSPSQAELAEQSRADSQARLMCSDRASIASLTWMNGSANSSTTSLGTPYACQNKSIESLHDRYSGGLDYGWERGAGFMSSAGTRSSGSEAKRKSVRMSESYGLDLSDVPVFLQRAR